jgi:hypothetical protein
MIIFWVNVQSSSTYCLEVIGTTFPIDKKIGGCSLRVEMLRGRIVAGGFTAFYLLWAGDLRLHTDGFFLLSPVVFGTVLTWVFLSPKKLVQSGSLMYYEQSINHYANTYIIFVIDFIPINIFLFYLNDRYGLQSFK